MQNIIIYHRITASGPTVKGFTMVLLITFDSFIVLPVFIKLWPILKKNLSMALSGMFLFDIFFSFFLFFLFVFIVILFMF